MAYNVIKMRQQLNAIPAQVTRAKEREARIGYTPILVSPKMFAVANNGDLLTCQSNKTLIWHDKVALIDQSSAKVIRGEVFDLTHNGAIVVSPRGE